MQLPGRPRLSYANMTPELAVTTLDALLAGETPASHLLGSLTTPAMAGDGRRTATATRRRSRGSSTTRCWRRRSVSCFATAASSTPRSWTTTWRATATLAFERCLSLSPGDVVDLVRLAGLRGRGGAGFPTWRKWQACRDADGARRYLICNADEGDPGAFMNRSLIEGDPHAVLEGMLIAAYAIGAEQGFVYIRAEYPLAIRRLRTAIAAMRRLGLLGEDILGSGFSFDLAVKEGAGAFVCGEETALIASLEGRRGMPRTRPPFPAESGLWGMPTIIDNVETLATLPVIVNGGAERYATLGTETSRGTKTFSLVGKVRRTGLIEVPFGMTLRRVIEDVGGGVAKGFKAVQTGGPSGGCLGEEFLDTPLDYENLAAAGSILGSGGLIVLDQDTCIVDTARYFLGFTQDESCGKCVPCRIGTGHLVEILDAICRGQGRARRPRPPREARPRRSSASSLCGLGQTAPNPVLTALKYFRSEFVEHIVDRRCRADRLPRPRRRIASSPASAPAASAACRSAPPAPSPARAPRHTTSIRRSASSAAPATRSAGSTPSPATPS